MRRGMFAILSSFVLTACSSDGGGGGAAPGSLLALGCDDALDSVYRSQTPPPDWGPEMRGDITQCAFERTVSIDEMAEAFAVSDSFIDPGLSTPVYKYRVQYWTERNAGEPMLTSAALYIPETRRADPSIPIVPNSSDPADP